MDKQQIILAENIEKNGTNEKAARNNQTNYNLPVCVGFPPLLTRAFASNGLETATAKNSQIIHKGVLVEFCSIIAEEPYQGQALKGWLHGSSLDRNLRTM